MQRIVKMSNYRNIGLEKDEKIILNHTLEKGKMGDLVIVVGPNNSGKSNVLDAISSIANKDRLDKRDITELSFEEELRRPSISLVCQDENEKISYSIDLNGTNCELKAPIKKIVSSENFNDELKKIYDLLNKFSLTKEGEQIKQFMLKENLPENEFENKLQEVFEILLSIERENRCFSFYNQKQTNIRNFLDELEKSNNKIFKELKKYSMNDKEKANDHMMEKYGIKALPNIITYKENSLKKQDLIVSYNNISDSLFFKSIFKAIGIDANEIIKAHKQFEEFNNRATLNKINNKIKGLISKLNNQFNKMYFAEKDQYNFSVDLEANQVSFGMARGKNEDPIMLEYQSTGFKWFFNLFFNFLCSNDLHPGDIIIMDEPATNLHPQGQIELRHFIKKFAKENDLTFVIATHSPFLVDVDNFDELRVVSIENNISKIDNLFTAVNRDDPDSLLPIKESLTIKQNILYDLDTEVIWVEGITDYNYLTLFKNLLNIKNVAFIPFNGVGENEKEQKEIISKLVDIRFYKRNILVDGDKAGKSMKKNCENTAFDTIKLLSDIGINQEKIIEIEDLFSEEDKKKFPVLNNKNKDCKKASLSVIMKQNCKLEDFSEETIGNFEKLFNYLLD